MGHEGLGRSTHRREGHARRFPYKHCFSYHCHRVCKHQARVACANGNPVYLVKFCLDCFAGGGQKITAEATRATFARNSPRPSILLDQANL